MKKGIFLVKKHERISTNKDFSIGKFMSGCTLLRERLFFSIELKIRILIQIFWMRLWEGM